MIRQEMTIQGLRDRLLHFIRNIGVSPDILAWSASLKQALGKLLPGVDRISVNVNRSSTIDSLGLDREIVSTMRAFESAESAGAVVLTASGRRDADYFIDSFRRSGFPVDDFRRPTCLNYEGPDGAYLGSIVLWQRVGSPLLSANCVDMLRQLTPFVTFLFASAIERYQATHRFYADALRAASVLIGDANLTRREREVFLCRFQGLSVSHTAERLSVSEATVRRHVRAINARLRELESPPPETLGLPFVRLQHTLD